MKDHPNGLTLNYFHHFIDIHGGRTAFQGLTTAQVCFQFVVPYTNHSKLSLVDHVRQYTNDANFVKPATWYISHAWSYIFLEVLDSLDSFFADKNDDPVLWFCVFANNQHHAAEMPFSWWQTTFKQSLEAIGNVVMILHPWNNPVTLTRSWCIFEVYVSILVHANFQVAMASNQAAVFFDDILDDISSFYMMLSCVNSRDAKSTVASDKASIDQVVEAEVGFVALDRMVLDRFEQWMRESLEKRIESAATKLDKAKYLKSLSELKGHCTQFNDSLTDITEAYTIYLNELGPNDPKALVAQGIQAIFRGYLLRPEAEWEPTLISVVAKLEESLGPIHKAPLSCMVQFGHLYGKVLLLPAKAVKILHVAYTRLAEVYGPLMPQTLVAKAVYICNQHGLVDDKTFFASIADCIAKLTHILGPNHPTTLFAITTALTCNYWKNYIGNELESYETTKRFFSEDRANPTSSTFNLARAFFKKGLIKNALEQAKKVMIAAHNSTDYCHPANEPLLEFTGTIHFELSTYELGIPIFEGILAQYYTSPEPISIENIVICLYWCYFRLGMTLDVVDLLIERFQRVNLWHDQWFGMVCDGCELPCFGILHMCATCTVISNWYCPACYNTTSDPKCTKCDQIFTPMVPPPRFLLKKKYELLSGLDLELRSIQDEIQKYCVAYSLSTSYFNLNPKQD